MLVWLQTRCLFFYCSLNFQTLEQVLNGTRNVQGVQCIACGVDCVWIFEGKPLGRLLVQMCSFQQVIHQISEMSELSRPSGFIQADPPVSDGKQNPGSSLWSSSLQALTALLSRECRQGGLSLYSSYNVQAHTSQ